MTRTERTYFVLTCLYRLSWSALGPTYALFLLSRGLDILQINLVFAVYLTTTCVFEMPTGAFADVIGRKRSFVLSCVLRAVAFGLYFFATGFAEFLVAEFIDAVGTTLTTGSLDAWAVDGIHRDRGVDTPADRLFARANIYGQATAILGGLGAAQIAEHNIGVPWLIGMAGFIVCGLAGIALMDELRVPPPPHAAPRALRSIGDALRDTLAAARTSPVLRGLCLLTVVTSFAMLPVFQTWQPRLQQLTGQGPWLLGWVWAFMNLAVIAGSALVPWLLRRFGRGGALALASAWRGVTLGIAALATTRGPALTGFLLLQVAFGFNEPIKQGWMNDYATAQRRATILSLHSMMWTFGGAVGLVCLGWLARDSSIGTAWLAAAIICGLAAPGFIALGRMARRDERRMLERTLQPALAVTEPLSACCPSAADG
jgi:MFS family permease